MIIVGGLRKDKVEQSVRRNNEYISREIVVHSKTTDLNVVKKVMIFPSD